MANNWRNKTPYIQPPADDNEDDDCDRLPPPVHRQDPTPLEALYRASIYDSAPSSCSSSSPINFTSPSSSSHNAPTTSNEATAIQSFLTMIESHLDPSEISILWTLHTNTIEKAYSSSSIEEPCIQYAPIHNDLEHIGPEQEQDTPSGRISLMLGKKREVIFILDLDKTFSRLRLSALYRIGRTTIDGYLHKQEELRKLPQQYMSRQRQLKSFTIIENDIQNGFQMATHATEGLFYVRCYHWSPATKGSYRRRFSEYLERASGKNRRLEGYTFSVKYDGGSAVENADANENRKINPYISSLLLCNGDGLDMSTEFVRVQNASTGSDKVLCVDIHDEFDEETFNNFLIRKDKEIRERKGQSIVLLIDESELQLLIPSERNTVPRLTHISVVMVPTRFGPLLPTKKLAETTLSPLEVVVQNERWYFKEILDAPFRNGSTVQKRLIAKVWPSSRDAQERFQMFITELNYQFE
ncbi:hypothetical protein BGZ49_004760 [Haplosporangium sp. Z 27]|nr:hypothetical protein BGZ49_004760 [Haplosporangium sp. Z 27]